MTARKSGQLWISKDEDSMESMFGLKPINEHYILLETRWNNPYMPETEVLWYVFLIEQQKVFDLWESSMSCDILVADVNEESL